MRPSVLSGPRAGSGQAPVGRGGNFAYNISCIAFNNTGANPRREGGLHLPMKIVNYPHPALRDKAEPVTLIDKELHLLAGRMLELMYEHEGLGLAAPQVAQPKRLLVMNFSGDPNNKEQEYVAVNPVILEQKGSVEDREGCLSFPGLFQKVRRARTVKVQAYNLRGELYEMTASEMPARVWQHEIDHLNGVLFIDRMGMFGRMASRKALEELMRDFEKMKERGEYPPELEPKL